MTFTSSELLMTLLGGVAVILILIFAIRRKFSNQSKQLIADNKAKSVPILLKKHPEVDVFRFNNIFFRVGLMCSLGFAIVAFNWTSFDNMAGNIIVYDDKFIDEQDIPVVPPEAKTPPPPPPVEIEDVPDDMIDEDIDVGDLFVDIDDDFIEPFKDEPKKVTKIKVVKEKDDEGIPEPDFFIRVEEMPAFPGCENILDEAEKKACTESSLLKHIYNNLDYPSVARDNGIEGTVVVSFMIDKNGAVTKVEVVKDIGAGCGEEAANAIKSMNKLPQKWSPGKQRTKSVVVKYIIPIRFKLQK